MLDTWAKVLSLERLTPISNSFENFIILGDVV